MSDDRLRHTVTVAPRPWKWIVKRVAEWAFILYILVNNLRIVWEETHAPGVSVSPTWMALGVLFAFVFSYFYARLLMWVAKWIWRGLCFLFRLFAVPRAGRSSRGTAHSVEEVNEGRD